MKLMYDSTNPYDIPADADVVAGYANGLYRWSGESWRRFTGRLVTITVRADQVADVADCETGDLTVSELPGWVRLCQRAGIPVPTVYVQLDRWTQARAACVGLTVDWWVAYWTGRAQLVEGSVATQYADPIYSGGHYDLSVCRDDWPRPAPAPAPAPPGDEWAAEAEEEEARALLAS